MARLTIDLPEEFSFSTEVPVLISHINRGDHLGNDSLVGLLNEARIRYLQARQFNEYRVQGPSIVNADLAVSYKSEAHYGETLKIEVAAAGFHRVGYDIVYRVTSVEDGRLIALARTSHILIDPESRRVTAVPAGFLAPLEE